MIEVVFEEAFPDELMISHYMQGILIETGTMLGWNVEKFTTGGADESFDSIDDVTKEISLPPPGFN